MSLSTAREICYCFGRKAGGANHDPSRPIKFHHCGFAATSPILVCHIKYPIIHGKGGDVYWSGRKARSADRDPCRTIKFHHCSFAAVSPILIYYVKYAIIHSK